VLAGCVTTQTRYYVPTEGQPRMGANEMKDQAESLLRLECPRLLNGAATALGETQLVVDVGGGGQVSRARVARSSGDARVDAIFGGVLAQLEVDAPTDGKAKSSRVQMGYSCGPDQAVVTVRGIEIGDGAT
jgi:outer membrane biosynthesis protein TonB